MADRSKARSLRELFERLDRPAPEAGRPGGLRGEDCMGLVDAWKMVVDVLKVQPADRLQAAIWEMERDIEAITDVGIERLKAQHGGIEGLLKMVVQKLRPAAAGDGAGLDIRPPGGDRR
jgi:hypothetical protein